MRLRALAQQRAVAVAMVATAFLLILSTAVVARADAGAFEEELQLAGGAFGRRERVAHLIRALQLRPHAPEAISLKYRIAIALSQHGDPTDGSGPNPDEAIPWYEEIIGKYSHMDYYDDDASTGAWDPQMIVPRSRIQLASILLGQPDTEERRRRLLLQAMEEIAATVARRAEEWSSAPFPPEGDPLLGGLAEAQKLEARRSAWHQRRQDAALGEVLHAVEMRTVEAAVRQYGYTYGRQRPWEVRRAMEKLIQQFPGTHIAVVAQGHIDRAAQMTREMVDQELAGAAVEIPPDDLRGSTSTPGTDPATAVMSPAPPADAPGHPRRPAAQAHHQTWAWMWGAVAGAVLFCGLCYVGHLRRSRPQRQEGS